MSDMEKSEAVDRWLADVSEASRRWKSAKAAQEASETVVAYLEEISGRMRGMPPDLEERMSEAIRRNRENAEVLADAAIGLARLEKGFYEVMREISPPVVADVWRMRFLEGKTWDRCSRELHYSRSQLERLSREAKPRAYDALHGRLQVIA